MVQSLLGSHMLMQEFTSRAPLLALVTVTTSCVPPWISSLDRFPFPSDDRATPIPQRPP